MKTNVLHTLALLLLAGVMLVSLLTACGDTDTDDRGDVTTTAATEPENNNEGNENESEKENEENHVHAFGEWVVTQAATCTEEGSRQRTCSCGEVDYSTVEIVHKPGEDAVCTACGAVLWDSLEFTLNEDGSAYLVYGCSNGSSYVAIPAVYDGLPVTGIMAEAFFNIQDVQTVHVPASITHIEERAFHHNHQLMNLTVDENNSVYHSSKDCIIETATKTLVAGCHDSVIPADGSVTAIGSYAFLGADNYHDLVIPASVTVIGKAAFGDRSFYGNTLTVDPENTVYHSVNNLIVETATKTLVAGFGEFHEIPADGSVTAIGDYAFYYCHGLGTITLPEGITSIGDYAFASAWYLADVSLPNSLTAIGEGAFEDCRALTEITIPSGVTSISDRTFHMSSSLTSVTFKGNVTHIGNEAFYQNGLTSLNLPDSLISIGDYAFVYCSKLTEIDLPENLETIGANAFMQCTNLWRVTVGGKVTAIGEQAFRECSRLLSVTLGGGSPVIASGAFADCDKLIEVVNHSDLHIETNSYEHGGIALKAMSVHQDDQSRIANQNGYLFFPYTQYWLVDYLGSDTELTLPDAYVYQYEDDVIENRTYAIASYAFYNLELTAVTVPETVHTIASNAFKGCIGLTSVTLIDATDWHYRPSADYFEITVFPDGVLEDPATTAQYLLRDYVNYFWANVTVK